MCLIIVINKNCLCMNVVCVIIIVYRSVWFNLKIIGSMVILYHDITVNNKSYRLLFCCTKIMKNVLRTRNYNLKPHPY